MTIITPIRTQAEAAYISQFPAFEAGLTTRDPAGLKLRRAAFERFVALGLPHRRIEPYHYTDVRALLREVAGPTVHAKHTVALPEMAVLPSALSALEAFKIVLVNGVLDRARSDLGRLPDGVKVHEEAEPAVDGGLADDPMIALNTAFMTGRVVIKIAAGIKFDTPLHLQSMIGGAAVAVYPRVTLEVGAGAAVTLVESHFGPDGVAYQNNSLVEIVAGDDAKIDLVRVNAHGKAAADFSTLVVTLGASNVFNAHSFVTGGALSRHQVFLRLEGEHSVVTLSGAMLLNARQHADTTLVVDHAVPNCQSREHFAHVLDGEATGVFQGKIIVRPLAQKTDGKMMSRAVVLTDGATMNNKPELEIFADDVQCGHGATVGALDEDLLFYLQARGLPKTEAEALMLQAFAGEAVAMIAHDGVREALNGAIDAWLKARA
jgi:Fe-S cluster assembly protein SufD